MQLLTLLTALALPAATFAAKAKGSTFSKFHSKALSSAPIIVDDASYSELTATPRDYGVLACLTALDARYGCKICQELKPEWDVLAKSWTKGDKDAASRMLFATLDFADGRQTFQSLQLDTAPIIMYYPPTSGPNASPSSNPVRFDFTTGNPTAEQIHGWLSRQLPDGVPKPSIRRPINWLRIGTISILSLGAITATFVAWPYVGFIAQSRNVWAAFSLVAVLLFTSGHMYNQIRGAPYVAGDGKGGVSYFAPGFQSQYGIESQIVAGIYGVLAFATISLALRVPRMKEAKSQQAAVFIWAAVMYLMYSFLLSVFRTKNGGYPYSLPPF